MLHLPQIESAVVLEGGESTASLQHPDGVLIAVGIEHSTAPVAVRERVVLQGERLEEAHRVLVAHPATAEVAILSTCNRTELYLFAREPAGASDVARAYLMGADHTVQPYVREWRDLRVAEHLFRVSAGLRSRVLGEQQILSQVRDALAHAERLSTAGSHLHQLFQSAIACGRAVRQATSLGRVDASIAFETIRAAELAVAPLHQRTALVVGGGEISRLAAAELRRREIGRLYVTNRTPSVADELAEQHGGEAVPLAEIGRHLPAMDIVISATSAPWRILTAEDIHAAELDHRRVPLHLFDLALPRDIDPRIGELPGVVLHDLDSLIPIQVREQREEDVRAAEVIVRDHVLQLERWYRTRRVAPLIAELRRQVDEIAASEVSRASPRLAGLSQDEREAVAHLTNRMTNAIFHRFVTRLRLAACTGDRRLVEAAGFFFGSDAGCTQEPVPIDARDLAHVTSHGRENR